MMASCERSHMASQRGVSLLFSLLILLVLSVAGVASMQTAGLGERQAGNSRDRTTAFNAAESALRDAEAYLAETTNLPLFNGTTAGHYARNTFPGLTLTRLPALALQDGTSVDQWNDPAAITYIKNNGVVYGSRTSKPALPDVTTQPRFILEEVNPEDLARFRTYRITAIGIGRDAATVVLQSYYTPPQFTVTM